MEYTKKSLGQNFLIDDNILRKIVNLADIKNNNILEIGPGKGVLTDKILEKNPKSLIVVEKDNSLFKKLKIKYKANKKIKIYNEDILKFELDLRLKEKTIIFGNLPYNISSQILVKIVKLNKIERNCQSLILMFQKEMAERIDAKFNTSKYGRLSILRNYKFNVIKKFNVSPFCFFPKPKVISTVILLKPNKKMNFHIKNIDNLEKVTNIMFSNKRKMINKSLKKILNQNQINLIKDLDLNSRPADLNFEKYYKITELFESEL